jgi:hypothetical protein
MIKVTVKGSFRNADAFLQRMKARSYLKQLEKFGAQGVVALRNATPVESGATADSWTYEIIERPGYFSIQWLNTHTEEPGHIPVAVLVQYGHGTRAGHFIAGLDYINPAMRPIFEQIAIDMWREVTR